MGHPTCSVGCGAGNIARSRLSGGSFGPRAPGKRRLKAGCSQDWLPHWMRLLALVALLALGIPASHAQSTQLDCNQPVDVTLTPGAPQASVSFSGSAGETVYIRLLASVADPGFRLNPPVVVGPFGSLISPRTTTPGDLAGTFEGSFSGLEFDLFADGTHTLRLVSYNPNLGASLHIVLTRINRPCSANTTLACGHSLAGTISTSLPGQVDTYQFSVQTGDVVRFSLLRVAASGVPNTNTGFFLAIYAADPAQNNRPFAVNVDQIGRASCRERV